MRAAKTPTTPFPLRRAGWSDGDCRIITSTGALWLVTGNNGENGLSIAWPNPPIRNPKSAIRNPQSEIHNPQSTLPESGNDRC